MPLIHHDTTGTATDCPRPLSRKKLKQLMPQNHDDLTRGSLMNPKNPFFIAGRKPGLRIWRKAAQKRAERTKLRKKFALHKLPDGTEFHLVPTPAEVEAMKPTLFERMGGLFDTMRRKFEREKARGK